MNYIRISVYYIIEIGNGKHFFSVSSHLQQRGGDEMASTMIHLMRKKVNGFSLFLSGSFAIPRTDSQPVDMDDAVVEFDLGAVVALEPVDI